MPSVLHLRGLSADAQTDRLHAALVARLGADLPSSTRTIGPGGDDRQPVAAAVSLRRDPPELLVAWGMPALVAAALAGRSGRLLFVPDRYLGPRPLRWARTLLDRTGGHMACPTDAQRRAAVLRGVPPDRCHVIRPGVDFGRVRRTPEFRRQLRAELGFADGDTVLFAPGDSTAAADHERAVWTCGILHILDPAYKVLIQGRGNHASAAVRLAKKLKQSDMMAAAEPRLGRAVSTEDLLAAADACLLAPAGVVPTLPILSAMAAGLPFVTVATYVMSELLEDRHTALMVSTVAPKALGRRVMDLRADPALAARVADTARAEAYELHTLSRMVERYRRVLRQLWQGRAVDPEVE
jgi:glycosyltransferase involved in cell wall biosynthesis